MFSIINVFPRKSKWHVFHCDKIRIVMLNVCSACFKMTLRFITAQTIFKRYHLFDKRLAKWKDPNYKMERLYALLDAIIPSVSWHQHCFDNLLDAKLGIVKSSDASKRDPHRINHLVWFASQNTSSSKIRNFI